MTVGRWSILRDTVKWILEGKLLSPTGAWMWDMEGCPLVMGYGLEHMLKGLGSGECVHRFCSMVEHMFCGKSLPPSTLFRWVVPIKVTSTWMAASKISQNTLQPVFSRLSSENNRTKKHCHGKKVVVEELFLLSSPFSLKKILCHQVIRRACQPFTWCYLICICWIHLVSMLDELCHGMSLKSKDFNLLLWTKIITYSIIFTHFICNSWLSGFHWVRFI